MEMNMQPKTKNIPKKTNTKTNEELIIELLKNILAEVKLLKKQYTSAEEIFKIEQFGE